VYYVNLLQNVKINIGIRKMSFLFVYAILRVSEFKNSVKLSMASKFDQSVKIGMQ